MSSLPFLCRYALHGTVTAMARWSLGELFGLKKPPPPAKPRPPETKFHAVSIIPGERACAAAYRFTGQRFLSAHAPRVPLPMCDSPQCTCRYKHHRDRRAGPRRRGEVGMMTAPYSGTERRRSRGRRAEDRY
jgi:hypothetical protein